MKVILFLTILALIPLSLLGRPGYSEGDYSEDELKDYVLSESNTLNRTILFVKKRYLDPTKIDSQKMFFAALNHIERSVPQVIISHDLKGEEVTVKVEATEKSFRFPKVETVWQLSLNLRDIFLFLEKNIKLKKDQKNVELSAVEGMLTTLDPHSSLLRPSLYTEMKMNNAGKFGGLGIVISMRDGNLTVVSPIEDTPAFRAGIRSRDQIVRINNESTVGMSLSQAVDRMRGEPGTPVTLYIMRKGWQKSRPFTLKRALIKMKSVSSKLLKGGIGYVKIKSFQGNTASDLVQHLNTLQKKSNNELRGLILDLRNDPGGLLDQAIKVADIFLKKGYIVSTVGMANLYREDKEAEDEKDEPTYPIIVLTNSGSASASEIVAGALKMNKRALLIGERTFGKGSVQTLFEFGDRSALKLTIAQYLIAKNVSIQSVGITPDILVTPVILAKEDISYYSNNHSYHESDYESHIVNSKNKVFQGKSLMAIRYLFEDKRSKEEKEDAQFKDVLSFKSDFEIDLVRRLLLQAKSINSDNLYKEVQSELQKIQGEQDQIIAKKLTHFKTDWTKGALVNEPKLKVEFITKPVQAGNKLVVKAIVTNQGDKTLYRLRANSDSETYFLRGTEFLFGKVDPGKSVFWEAHISIPKGAETQKTNLKLDFFQDEIESNISKETYVTLQGLNKPYYQLSYGIKDSDGDGKIAQNEKISLKIKLKNIGKGDGTETTMILKNKTSSALFIHKGHQQEKAFKAGSVVNTTFSFEIKKPLQKKNIMMDLWVYDTEMKQFKKFDITLPFKKKIAENQFPDVHIKLKNTPPLLISKDQKPLVNIKGDIEGEVLDYYIYVAKSKKLKYDFDKIFFRSNSDKKQKMSFDVDAPLKPGLNRITIVARLSESLMTTKEVIVFYDAPQKKVK